MYQTVPSWEREDPDMTDSTHCGPFMVKKSLSAVGAFAALLSVCLLFLTFYNPTGADPHAVYATSQQHVTEPQQAIGAAAMIEPDDEEDVSDFDPFVFAAITPSSTGGGQEQKNVPVRPESNKPSRAEADKKAEKAVTDVKQASREALEKAKVAVQAEIDRLDSELNELEQNHVPQIQAKITQAKDKLVEINKELAESQTSLSASSCSFLAPAAALTVFLGVFF